MRIRNVTFDEHTIDFDNGSRMTHGAGHRASFAPTDTRGRSERSGDRRGTLKKLHAEFDPELPLGNLMGACSRPWRRII